MADHTPGQQLERNPQPQQRYGPRRHQYFARRRCVDPAVAVVAGAQPAVGIQDSYHVSGYTDIYWYSTGWAAIVASTDYDYSTEYYYGNQIYLDVFDNGIEVDEETWGVREGEAGFGTASADVIPNPGDYIEARSWYGVVTQYEWSQVIANCGALCDSWYDPFDYDFVEGNPEGTTIPTFYANIWATVVVEAVARAASIINVGQNGNSFRVPGGSPSVFDLKFRAFIPPAWVRGPDPCLIDNNFYGGTIYGGDNRTFDPFSPHYRAHAEAVVSSVTGSWSGMVPGGISNPSYRAGTTVRYGSDALAPDGYTLQQDYVLHDCHFTDDVFQEDSSQMSGSVHGASGSVTTNFYGSVNDQTSDLGTETPGLGYNVTYTINTASNPAIPAYTLDYSHKCYPAYEAYIGSQQVYGYMPLSNSPAYVTACLVGGLVISGSTIGAVTQ